MWPVSLPDRPDDPWLRSFALGVAFLLGGSASVLWLMGGFAGWMMVGSAVAVSVAIPGALWPGLTAPAYAVWNRIARGYGRRAARVVIWIFHRLVFRVTARPGSKLSNGKTAPRSSQWEPARALPEAHFEGMDRSGDPASSRASARNLLNASLRGGSAWMVGTIPYLVLVRALEVDDHLDAPSGIYTLY